MYHATECFDFWHKGLELQASGQYRLAIQLFLSALNVDHEFCYAHNSLSVSYYYLGQYDLGLTSIVAAIALAPNVSRFHYQRGVILAQMGALEAAIEEHTIAIGISGGRASYFVARGIVNERLARWEPSINDFKEAIRLDNNCWEAHLKLADILSTCDDSIVRSKSCLDHAKMARRIAGRHDWRVFAVLAAAYAENDLWKLAEQAAQRACCLAPDEEKERRESRLGQIIGRVRLTRS